MGRANCEQVSSGWCEKPRGSLFQLRGGGFVLRFPFTRNAERLLRMGLRLVDEPRRKGGEFRKRAHLLRSAFDAQGERFAWLISAGDGDLVKSARAGRTHDAFEGRAAIHEGR